MPAETLSAEQVVAGYKRLSHVEQAFRSLKTTMLQLRPIYPWRDDRIRAHVLLCMLAYYVQWHLRRDLRPLLFHDEQREAAEVRDATHRLPASSAGTPRSLARSIQVSRTPHSEFGKCSRNPGKKTWVSSRIEKKFGLTPLRNLSPPLHSIYPPFRNLQPKPNLPPQPKPVRHGPPRAATLSHAVHLLTASATSATGHHAY